MQLGASSSDIRWSGAIRLTGPTCRVGPARVLHTPAYPD
jgi:beta-glucosidase